MKVKGAIAVKTRFANMEDVFTEFVIQNAGESFTMKELMEATGADLATSIFFTKNSSDIECVKEGRRGRGGAAIFRVKNVDTSKITAKSELKVENELEPEIEVVNEVENEVETETESEVDLEVENEVEDEVGIY